MSFLPPTTVAETEAAKAHFQKVTAKRLQALRVEQQALKDEQLRQGDEQLRQGGRLQALEDRLLLL